jgi:hypothetical protein
MAYQLKTFADLVSAVREELKVASNDTNAIIRIKRDINMIYAEVLNEHRWWWLQGHTTVMHQPYVSTGTASVTVGSSAVTLSIAPSTSKTGYYFSVDGSNDVYKIESHTASSTSIVLTDLYTGTTNSAATFKIWSDKVPLPVDCKETIEVYHGHNKLSLESVGLQEFRRVSIAAPKSDGKPQFYYTGDFVDPSEASSISGLPAITSRASSGILKTIVFAATVPTSITAGSRLRLTGAGHPSYNGDITVRTVSTTTVSNDTITYVGRFDHTESATSDSSLLVKSIGSEVDSGRYRELFVFPALISSRLMLHVDYIKEASPLENDSDEPVVPLEESFRTYSISPSSPHPRSI